jgi:hypothetical protein
VAGDWSLAEVEATVTDYLSMLDLELREQPYSKTEHRRGLQRMLSGRTDAAIERKHQNISAILIEMGLPYVSGYKPLGNYQHILREAVAARLDGNRRLLTVVEEVVERPATVPSVDDILAAMESRPIRAPGAPFGVRDRTPDEGRVRTARQVDYLAKETRNRSLGAAGEEFVLQYETALLRHHGQARLADRIEHVSTTRGDGLGFDVLSFEPDGREKLIEVKTTAFGKQTPFYVTRNELECSRERAPEYRLYRVFGFRREPRLFALEGRLDEACALEAVQYVGRVT